MSRRPIALVATALLSLAPLALVACSTPGYKKGDSAADTMQGADKAAASLLIAAQNAETYLASMQEGELKPLFARFEKEVDGFDSNLKRLRGSLADVRSNTNGYIDSLKKTSAALTNPELRAKTDARIANIAQQLSEIDGYAAQADTAAQEVSAELSDLRNFLRADLSARGLADAAPSKQKLADGVKRLGATIEELKRQLADVQTAVASGS